MNINDLTIGEAKELANMFGKGVTKNKHPMIGRHCIIRTYGAGVHFGIVDSVDGSEVLLKNARRLWKWEGAFSLSEVATNGVNKGSRIAVEVGEIFLTGAIEFVPTTEKARKTYEACGEK